MQPDVSLENTEPGLCLCQKGFDTVNDHCLLANAFISDVEYETRVAGHRCTAAVHASPLYGTQPLDLSESAREAFRF